MARTRFLKPSFFTNDNLAEISPLGRILFAGLWCHADREGRLIDRPKKMKVEILPYDECEVDNLLNDLQDREFIFRYSVGEENYIQITKFSVHQKPHYKESASSIPPPPGITDSYRCDPVSPKQRARIYERDNHKCVKCNSTENLTIDHIVLVSLGGTSNDDNLRTLCKQCNCKRPKDGSDIEVTLSSRSLTLNPSTLTLNPKHPGKGEASQKQTFNETEVSVALCRERGIVGVEEISLVADAVKAVGGDHVETATKLLDNWQAQKESGKFPQQLKAFVKEGHWKDAPKPKRKYLTMDDEDAKGATV